MPEDIVWVIPSGFALVALIGGIIARDRYILNMIAKNHEGSIKAIQESNSEVHERINRVKDEYVRRVDLDGHIVRLDSSVKGLATEMRASTQATNQRLDALLAHFAIHAKTDK